MENTSQACTREGGWRGEERSLARLWREGNPPEADERRRTCPCESRHDALMVIRASSFLLTLECHFSYTASRA